MIRYRPTQRTSPVLNLLSLIIIVALILVAGFAYWKFLLSAVDSKDETIRVFVIAQGESTPVIAEKLEKEKFIRSKAAFQLFLKQTGNAGKIQAGDFKLASSMSSDEVLKQLLKGSVDKWVTLIEGWRVEEMAEKLNAQVGIDQEEFITAAKPDEGYLFPDTYLINPDVTTKDLIGIFKANFDKKYDDDLQSRVKKQGLTAKQGVILASIVEREARSDAVRRQVASILLKRFKIEMGLNADATVQYILGYQGEEKSWWKRHLTREDLKVDSPFNTYLYVGFPPEPICNPSLSSLQAVANASETDFLYYYHDSKGDSHYGKTLEEHHQNIADNP